MDKTIWKYELTMADKQYIEMPHGAEILCVQLQNDTPFLWALVTPKLAKENRLFEIFGTGHKIPFDRYAKRNFIGTFQIQNMLVFHLFERKPINIEIRSGRGKGAGRKKADYKTKTMVEKMNNATKKEVKALKITSVDMETIYFDMNGVECATDLSAFADWVQEEIGNIEISQDYLNPTDGHGTIETVYSAWEWIYEMVQETKLNEVFFFDYLKLPKTIER